MIFRLTPTYPVRQGHRSLGNEYIFVDNLGETDGWRFLARSRRDGHYEYLVEPDGDGFVVCGVYNDTIGDYETPPPDARPTAADVVLFRPLSRLFEIHLVKPLADQLAGDICVSLSRDNTFTLQDGTMYSKDGYTDSIASLELTIIRQCLANGISLHIALFTAYEVFEEFGNAESVAVAHSKLLYYRAYQNLGHAPGDMLVVPNHPDPAYLERYESYYSPGGSE